MFGAESLISKVVYQKEFRDSQIRNSSKQINMVKASIFRIQSPDEKSRDESSFISEIENVDYVDIRSIQYSSMRLRFCPSFLKGFSPPLFTEYEPCYFRNIRAASGIDADEYYKSFLTPLKAVLNQSGGTSNAVILFTNISSSLSSSHLIVLSIIISCFFILLKKNLLLSLLLRNIET
jgi:hypothetical protein